MNIGHPTNRSHFSKNSCSKCLWASRSYRVHVTSINKKFGEASLCTVNFAKWLQFRLIGGFRFLLVVKDTKLFAMNYLKGINFCEN